MKNNFTKLLLQWNKNQNFRQMPWKGETNPYKIWLSEIILQQTRVAQGLAYYNNFVAAFPTVIDLAQAPEATIMKMWEGLGYYSRCRNLIATAKVIAEKYNGIFPTDYNDVIALKGIGAYTAAAIVSFAYNQPYAVLDGNVYRVLSRYFGNNTPIDSNEGKQLFTAWANLYLDKKQPAAYNQAIMDFGATLCTPKLPQCNTCPLQNSCVAFETNTVNELPVKLKKTKVRNRFFNYIILTYKNEVLVKKRSTGDVWMDLYEFYLLEETESSFDKTASIKKELTNTLDLDLNSFEIGAQIFQQKLSHQTIKARFTTVALNKKSRIKEHLWIKKSEISKLPFPALLNQYFSVEKTSV